MLASASGNRPDLDAGLLGQRGEPLHAVQQCLVAAAGKQQRRKPGWIGIHRIGQRIGR
jgi:hypothetical protein